MAGNGTRGSISRRAFAGTASALVTSLLAVRALGQASGAAQSSSPSAKNPSIRLALPSRGFAANRQAGGPGGVPPSPPESLPAWRELYRFRSHAPGHGNRLGLEQVRQDLQNGPGQFPHVINNE